MSGHLYSEPEPREHCPYCGSECEADFCDVGVGFIQCGPYHCEICGASEIGAYDAERPLTPTEKSFGWYAPGSMPGSSANVIGGKIVGHEVARDAYFSRFAGSPDWEDEKVVSGWWDSQRKGEANDDH